MKKIFFVLSIGLIFFGCKKESTEIIENDNKLIETENKQDDKVEIEKNDTEKKIEEIAKQEFVDINGDGKNETISLVKNLDKHEKAFVFEDSEIPNLKAAECTTEISDLFSVGDIDEDGILELGLFNTTCTSRFKSISVFTLKNNEWQKIGNAVFDLNFKDEIPLSKRVVKIKKNEFKIEEKYDDFISSEPYSEKEAVDKFRYFRFNRENWGEVRNFIDVKNKKESRIFLTNTEWDEDQNDVKYFTFENKNVPKIKTSSCSNIEDLFEIGDIDEDGDVEIGMYYSGCTGRIKSVIVWSLVDDEWKEIGKGIFDYQYQEPHFSERVKKVGKGKFTIYEKYNDDLGKLKENYKFYSFDGKISAEK